MGEKKERITKSASFPMSLHNRIKPVRDHLGLSSDSDVIRIGVLAFVRKWERKMKEDK